tara:strand:+ start:1219 stop:1509 length:291 start_codon:yes stop_codon:yes gene_type:complete
MMHSHNIQKVIDLVVSEFGKLEYYGSSEIEEHGACFKLTGINATFSISTLDATLTNTIDVQIEGIPAGDYLFTTETTHQKFIELIKKYKGPETQWP